MAKWTNKEADERKLVRDLYGRRGAPWVLQALAKAIRECAETFQFSEDERARVYEDYQYQFKWALASEERKLKDAMAVNFKLSEGE